MRGEYIASSVGLQSLQAQPENFTIFAPQSERQRQLIAEVDTILEREQLRQQRQERLRLRHLVDALEAIDAILEKDRLWFDAHPDRTLRFRRATEAEIEIDEENGVLAPLPPGMVWATMVFCHSGRTLAWAFVDFHPDLQPEYFCECQCRLLVRIGGRRFPEG